MEIPVQGEAKQCTSQSEFILLSSSTRFQYWMPSSDSPEHISNGVSLQKWLNETADIRLSVGTDTLGTLDTPNTSEFDRPLLPQRCTTQEVTD
ncbi:hypothetical protein AVEN_237495-1 [Araneus ventricosus]|uniref:Uncharacterized protein n=1 Tax=Araneus ventricosus TaxID=182803 RepID=A0A4Y2QAT8_ARAVE|nr:hypothetical protein AVEN_237495-1 [Araneus ventricosus]